MLVKIDVNEYGNILYRESEDGDISIEELDKNIIWAVKDPSMQICNFGTTRKYGDATYLLSDKAVKCIPPEGEGGGSVVVIRIHKNNTEYFLLTADNKKYIMNCGGRKNVGETYGEGAIRKVEEELNIELSADKLRKHAIWEFYYQNKLIGVSWKWKTMCFVVDLEPQHIEHLTTDFSEIDTVEVVHEKLQYVFLVAADKIEAFDGACGRNFGGHHKKLILDICGIKNNIDVSYLNNFRYV
jgi:8-oxo-dGTP pyrophosphatase MutT (NUDIX family)